MMTLTGASAYVLPSPRSRASAWGGLIRASIVLAWLGLFGFHAGIHLLQDAGLKKGRDTEAVVTAHVGHTYSYHLKQGDHILGRISQDYDYLDGTFPVRLKMDLQNLSFVPGAAFMRQQIHNAIGIDINKATSVDMTVQLNKDFRLDAITMSGNIGGRRVTFDGSVGAQGMVGTMDLGGGRKPETMHLPEVMAETSQGLAMASALPPHLKVGESYSTPALAPLPTPPFFKQVRTTTTVEAQEQRSTRVGDKNLLRVTLSQEGKHIGTMWCDDAGIVYESHDATGGMQMVLRTIHHQSKLIWPPASDPVTQ